MSDAKSRVPGSRHEKDECLAGKRAAVILYSCFPSDPRPRREAEALAAKGMEVDLICLRDGGNQNDCNKRRGINILRVPLRRRREGKLTYLFQYLLFTIWAFAIVSVRSIQRGYSIVHVHNMPDWLIFAAIVPKLLGAKLILDLHDPMPELAMTMFRLPPHHWLIQLCLWCERGSIRLSDLTITPNVAFQRLFSSRSCPAEKVQIVMNAPQEKIFDPTIYPSLSRPPGGKNRSFVLMYHGLLVERHGLADAVRALWYLRKRVPHAKLLIYGEPTRYLDLIRSQIRQLGLQEMVEYRGWQPLDGIAKAISGIDLGIIPNIRTPFTELNLPTRILEYLAMGKPVIVPRTMGIRDYFSENEALYFEPGNPWDLAKKIEWASKHSNEVCAMLRRGQAVYKSHCWELQQRKFTELVSGLVRPTEPKPVSPRVVRPTQTQVRVVPAGSTLLDHRLPANS